MLLHSQPARLTQESVRRHALDKQRLQEESDLTLQPCRLRWPALSLLRLTVLSRSYKETSPSCGGCPSHDPAGRFPANARQRQYFPDLDM